MLKALKMRNRNYITNKYSFFFNASEKCEAHSLRKKFFDTKNIVIL